MKNSTRLFMLAAFLLISPFMAFSQISTGEKPITWNNSKIPLLSQAELMPLVDVESLKAEDAIDAQYKDLPFRFAYGHNVNFTPDNSGSWFEFPNGDRLWRLKIVSKGALSLGVTFAEYHLPEGAKLFIYSSDQLYHIGAFTSTNNKVSGYLGTTPIPGDELIVEYYEPADVSFNAGLTIETVAHGYRDIFKIAKDISQNKGFGDSGNCNNNVVCEEAEDWQNQIRSVALITLGNGTRWCSGSLINNVIEDGTPYFLTANHCTQGQNVSTWVFIFNYFSDICDEGGDGNDGILTQSISGSTLLENTNTPGSGNSTDPMQTDMALLLLDETPPDEWDVFYSGWDWSGEIPSFAVGIHHPAGDVKKISWDTDPTGVSGYLDQSGTGGGTTHWHINDWEDGTTEGGSSGSPLFNDSHQVIGQLHGGYADCSNNVDDYYGRLTLSFQFIQEWLDPDGTGVTSINGWPSPIVLEVDPGLNGIDGIEPFYCDVDNISPSITIKNYGLTEINAVDIDYFLDGNQIGTYNWTGSLLNGEMDSFEIGSLEISESGNHVFYTEFDFEGDMNLNNNKRTVEFYSIIGSRNLTIKILTDDYGSETTWSVNTIDGIKLASGGPYPNDVNDLYVEDVCIPDTCVTFIIFDSVGDGICCGYGEGSYQILIDTLEVTSGGEFGDEESTIACPPIVDAIDEINPLNSILIYPNPAHEQISLMLGDLSQENLTIHITNLMGQTISTINTSRGEELLKINVKDLPRGMYILEVSNKKFKSTFKIVFE
jgi:hypothetical protein